MSNSTLYDNLIEKCGIRTYSRLKEICSKNHVKGFLTLFLTPTAAPMQGAISYSSQTLQGGQSTNLEKVLDLICSYDDYYIQMMSKIRQPKASKASKYVIDMKVPTEETSPENTQVK